jgi:hypothetical protein
MITNALTVAPETLLSEAEEMLSRRLLSPVVTEAGKLVGLLTLPIYYSVVQGVASSLEPNCKSRPVSEWDSASTSRFTEILEELRLDNALRRSGRPSCRSFTGRVI